MAITEKELREAKETWQKYKKGKTRLEDRIVEEEKWYRLRHWDVVQQQGGADRPKPTSAWLFNAVMNKHADAMDNFPECNVLPREEGDRRDAETLSSIIPVILERCKFEGTYSHNWWEKLKHGTAVYGAFWNPTLENGLGDIDVKQVDILNIFWEPGIQDIQDSRNLFVVNLRDNDLLEAEYPQLKGKIKGGDSSELKQYTNDETIDLSDKSAVVDWYYKVKDERGRTLVHYAKFVGDTLLFASENEAEYADRGFYDHGKYPFVFDVLFPEKGTPCGFGYVALCKDPQMYIDKLSQVILENAVQTGRKRWLIAQSVSGINEKELLDWDKPMIHVEGGSLDDAHLREWETKPISGNVLNVLQMKIDEMKETSSNRDMSNGGTASGVTAAAAIAALQEAGNKTSRDMIAASYRAYTQLDYLVIELVRQFYSQERSFRITGRGADDNFVRYSNANIKTQETGVDSQGNPLMRRPVFDIKVKAQKKNPFSRMSQNELAKELYSLGVFNPERAQETEGMLEMMEFEGKDRVLEKVRQGATLYNQVQQLSQQVAQLSQIIGIGGVPAMMQSGGGGTVPTAAPGGAGQSMEQTLEGSLAAARTPYMDRIAKRSQVDMDAGALTPGV